MSFILFEFKSFIVACLVTSKDLAGINATIVGSLKVFCHYRHCIIIVETTKLLLKLVAFTISELLIDPEFIDN